mmetsp:Transcript_16234/g.38620  ORF Transcript_16234/g.38620 Transcript_16234/m.38620 type:complete len:210 (+) Transcript_16234:790-1419(+)
MELHRPHDPIVVLHRALSRLRLPGPDSDRADALPRVKRIRPTVARPSQPRNILHRTARRPQENVLRVPLLLLAPPAAPLLGPQNARNTGARDHDHGARHHHLHLRLGVLPDGLRSCHVRGRNRSPDLRRGRDLQDAAGRCSSGQREELEVLVDPSHILPSLRRHGCWRPHGLGDVRHLHDPSPRAPARAQQHRLRRCVDDQVRNRARRC